MAEMKCQHNLVVSDVNGISIVESIENPSLVADIQANDSSVSEESSDQEVRTKVAVPLFVTAFMLVLLTPPVLIFRGRFQRRKVERLIRLMMDENA